MKNEKLSIADLKAKAGKAFLNVNAVKGGTMEDCHFQPEEYIVPCDATC